MRRFLVDNQLPAALSRWIEAQGCRAEHVLALDLGQSPDAAIWERAAAIGAAIVSKDEDFARLTLVRPESVANVLFVGAFAATFNDAGSAIAAYNCGFNGNISITQGGLDWNECYTNGTNSFLLGATSIFMACIFGQGPTVAQPAGVTSGVKVTFAACSMPRFSISGTGTAVTSDAVSIPKSGDVSLSGGATLVQSTDTTALGYTPTTPGDWPLQPTDCQDAIDKLAARSLGGTVTSVSFTGDGTVLSSTASTPVTSSGTLTAALKTQSANVVFCGPASGAAANPTFRGLVAADIPSALDLIVNSITTPNAFLGDPSGGVTSVNPRFDGQSSSVTGTTTTPIITLDATEGSCLAFIVGAQAGVGIFYDVIAAVGQQNPMVISHFTAVGVPARTYTFSMSPRGIAVNFASGTGTWTVKAGMIAMF